MKKMICLHQFELKFHFHFFHFNKEIGITRIKIYHFGLTRQKIKTFKTVLNKPKEQRKNIGNFKACFHDQANY